VTHFKGRELSLVVDEGNESSPCSSRTCVGGVDICCLPYKPDRWLNRVSMLRGERWGCINSHARLFENDKCFLVKRLYYIHDTDITTCIPFRSWLHRDAFQIVMTMHFLAPHWMRTILISWSVPSSPAAIWCRRALYTSVQRRTHVLGKSAMKTDMKRVTRLFGMHTNSDGGSVRASEIPNNLG